MQSNQRREQWRSDAYPPKTIRIEVARDIKDNMFNDWLYVIIVLYLN